MRLIKTAGDQFDPKDNCLYFIASGPSFLRIVAGLNKQMLCAVNEINKGSDVVAVREIIESGAKVFIDSGVYNLSMDHARAHNVSMNEALSLPPDAIDGFDDLYERYVDICSTIGKQSWGYIEIDQGGRANKIKTRARLEKLGLRPVPVYHPLNDGWDYFDYLAKRYDRICFGNVVKARYSERLRLIATAFLRRQKYPHLWIHLLGVTPNQLLHSCPTHSCDSSTWLSAVRWSNHNEFACGASVGEGFSHHMTYRYDDAIEGARNPSWLKSVRLHGFQAEIVSRNWGRFCRDYDLATSGT